MENTLREIFESTIHNKLIIAVILAIVFDTIFGIIRAIKQRKWNSSVGINGALRKIGMLIAVMALALVDYILTFNMIGFLPEDVRPYLGTRIGLTEFFSILFVAYEVVSILKNMYMSGLPVKWVWVRVYKFLSKYTDELPDTDGEIKIKKVDENQNEN